MSSVVPTYPSLLTLILRVAVACAERKRLLFVAFMLPCLLSAGIIWGVLTPQYKATTIFTTPPKSKYNTFSGISAFSDVAQMSGLGDLDLGELFSDDAEVGILQSYVKSRELQQQVIRKYDLAKHYKFAGKFQADLYKSFNSNVTFELNDEDMLELSIEDKDFKLARQMNDYLFALLDSAYKSLHIQTARRNRLFFEARLDSVTVQLDSIQNELTSFQKKNQFYDLGTQLTATMEYLTGLQSLRGETQVALDEEKKYRGGTARTEILQIRLDNLNKQMLAAKQNSAGLPLLDLSKAPQQAAQYAKLERELKRYLAMYIQLVQKYESARFEEINETDNLLVISSAWDNDKRISPPRTAIMLVLMAIYGLFAVALCVFGDFFQREAARQSEFYLLVGKLRSALLSR